MDNVLDWLDSKPRSSRVATLVALAVLPVIAVTVTSLLLPAAAPIAGCVAGICLFVAAFGYWHTVLAPERQAATNYKARTPVRTRRVIAAVIATAWVVILLLFGELAPGPLLGTMNVFVFLSLYTFFRATPEEAAEALAAYQEAQRERAAQAAREAEAAAADNDVDLS